jgi:O-antigen/teichoic acid export membrane protein
MKSQTHNKRKIFINTFFITIGSVLEKVFLFLITVIIARYLSVKEYGEYTTALGLATFFSMFANLNLNISIIRAINKNKNYQNEYFTGSLIIKSILSILVYISLIISLLFTGYSRNTVLLTLILGLVRIGSEFINTSYAYYEAHEKFNIIAVLLSAFTSLFLIGTIIIILLKGDYFDLVFVRLLVTLIFIILIFFLLKKDYYLVYDLKTIKDFFRKMLPFSGSFALQNITANCGIVLLPLLHGTIHAGIYQNAYLILTSFLFIYINLMRVLVPFLYKYPFKENKDKFQFTYDFYSKIFGIISFYLSIILFLYAQDILLLIFGTKYIASASALKIFSLAFPFISIASTIITTIDKQKINTIIDGLTTISQVILSFVLIYFNKVEGAATAIVISGLINYGISNYYLIVIKKFKYKETFYIILKLIIFILILYFIHIVFFSNYYFIISLIIESLIYSILILCFILKKDDLRIIKEIFATGKS